MTFVSSCRVRGSALAQRGVQPLAPFHRSFALAVGFPWVTTPAATSSRESRIGNATELESARPRRRARQSRPSSDRRPRKNTAVATSARRQNQEHTEDDDHGRERHTRDRDRAWVVLQCAAITDIDVTAAEMLERLDNELNAAGVHIAFAGMRTRLQEITLRYGLLETLDRDHFFPTVQAAVDAIG
jgi:hypothetical protein